MKIPAFKLSVGDWIRKLNYHYEEPIDFVHNFISLIYAPGARVQIEVDENAVKLTGERTIEDSLFIDAQNRSIGVLGRIIPPDQDYEALELVSGAHELAITGENRDLQVRKTADTLTGTKLTIHRSKRRDNEVSRLRRLFTGSDLEVILNGEPLQSKDGLFEFKEGEYVGKVKYDSSTGGKIHFYEKGRFVSSIPFVPGIDMYLHKHNLPATITMSKIITHGKGKEPFEQLNEALPLIMAQFLKSTYVQNLRAKSERGYQTVLRTLFNQYNDSSEISDLFRENIRFAGSSGTINPDFSIAFLRSNPGLELPAPESKLYEMLTGERYNGKHPDGKKQPNWLAKGMVSASLIALLGAASIGVKNVSSSSNDKISGNQVAQAANLASEDRDSTTPNFMGLLGILSDEKYSGGDYISDEDIARLLTRDAAGAVRFEGTSPYIRVDTSNHLFQDESGFMWDDKAPHDIFISDIVVDLPQKLGTLKAASTERKVDAVGRYVNKNFKYGGIPPERSGLYPDFMTALTTELKAICTSGNSYAAVLLGELGVTDIRYAVGTLEGGPHAWLELEKDGIWVIRDFTPTEVSEELQQLISARGGTQSSEGETITQIIKGDGTFFYEVNNEENTVISKLGTYLGKSGILLAGAAALGLVGAGAIEGMSLMKRRRRTSSAPHGLTAEEDGLEKLIQVRDILGVPVKVSDATGMRYYGAILYLPRTALDKTALRTAAEAVPVLELPIEERLKVYSAIARSAK